MASPFKISPSLQCPPSTAPTSTAANAKVDAEAGKTNELMKSHPVIVQIYRETKRSEVQVELRKMLSILISCSGKSIPVIDSLTKDWKSLIEDNSYRSPVTHCYDVECIDVYVIKVLHKTTACPAFYILSVDTLNTFKILHLESSLSGKPRRSEYTLPTAQNERERILIYEKLVALFKGEGKEYQLIS